MVRVKLQSSFEAEFTADSDRLLRSRLLLVSGCGAMLAAALVIIAIAKLRGTPPDGAVPIGAGLAILSAVTGALARVKRVQPRILRALSLVYVILMLAGMLLWVALSPEPRLGLSDPALLGSAVFAIISVAILPWSWKQALIVFLPMSIAYVLTFDRNPAILELTRPRPLLIAGGGALLCAIAAVTRIAFERSRMVDTIMRVLQDKYENTERELSDARRVHESMFPEPVLDGMLRLRYRYEPMDQIGGDFLFLHRAKTASGQRIISVVIIDVTGHGIAAALAVNRLHGELDRLYHRDPNISPAEVIRSMNSYIYTLMANHGVFATALCARFDAEARKLDYCNAGHPPAYLSNTEGITKALDSTALMLGVCGDDLFDPAPLHLEFDPGDRFIAYTDGAIEAQNKDGHQLGIDGLTQLITTGHASDLDGTWTEYLVDRVKSFRDGPALDDTLFVEVSWDKNQLKREKAKADRERWERDMALRVAAREAAPPPPAEGA